MKENFQGCTAIQCSDLDIDANSVEETSPGDMTSCQAIQQYTSSQKLRNHKVQVTTTWIKALILSLCMNIPSFTVAIKRCFFTKTHVCRVIVQATVMFMDITRKAKILFLLYQGPVLALELM